MGGAKQHQPPFATLHEIIGGHEEVVLELSSFAFPFGARFPACAASRGSNVEIGLRWAWEQCRHEYRGRKAVLPIGPLCLGLAPESSNIHWKYKN